jgi:hypothetical protein
MPSVRRSPQSASASPSSGTTVKRTITPRAEGLDQAPQCLSPEAASVEPLGEAAARLLEAVAAVESVRLGSTVRGGQEQQAAPAGACFLLDRSDEGPADPFSSAALVDHDRAELGCRLVVLERKADMDTRQPDDSSIQFSDDETIRGARRESVHPSREILDRRRIAELFEQRGQRSCVLRAGVSNRQAHGERVEPSAPKRARRAAIAER